MEKRQLLWQMVLGKLVSNVLKTEPGPLSYTINKNKLKHNTKAIKILEEKAGKNLIDLGSINFLLNMSLESGETKAKMNYWNFIKV